MSEPEEGRVRYQHRLLVAIAVVAMGLSMVAVVPPRAAAAAPTADECLVQATYRVFLDRDATAAEVDTWVARFASGVHRSRIATDLANSDEWLSVEVAKLYRAALDRDPDAAGSAYWVDQLRRGALVNRVGSLIYGSSEFYARAGGTPAAFVTDIYTRILGRSPDPAGHAYWLGQLDRRGRGAVAASFFASVESRQGRVRALYRQILGRSAEAGGLTYWVGQLVRINDVRLAVDLAASLEFRTRATAGCDGSPDGTTLRITNGTGYSLESAISADGRFVAFGSIASDLVPGDTNGQADVFVWDRSTGSTIRITDGNGGSWYPTISADGRYVAFESQATNLVPGDTNGHYDVFVWDRESGETTRLTDGNRGSSRPAISADGAHVAYVSAASNLVPGDVNNRDDVFVWDRDSGATVRVDAGNDDSWGASISGDGGYVTFASTATDLVSGDTNGDEDVFVWQRSTGTIERITDGNPHPFKFAPELDPVMSDDGRHVAFASYATNLVPGDTGGNSHIYVWDRVTRAVERITGGNTSSRNPDLSADGRFVAYQADAARDLGGVDAILRVWDRTTGTTALVIDGEARSIEPSVSADGRHVSYTSGTAGVGDVFFWERAG